MAEQFNQFDANSDGRVDAGELAAACNIAKWKAKKYMKLYDANGDGTLDLQEFEQLKLQILNKQPIQKIYTTLSANDQHGQFDANDDGRLDASELANACDITLQEAQNIIAQYDVDGDGMLDPQEFEQLKQQVLDQQRQQMTNTMAANDQYNQFDADNDGRVDANELAQACNISLAEAQNIIAQYDVDGDGMLDPQEFEQLKQQILEQQRQNMTDLISYTQDHNQFDADNDGRIDASELAQACNISLLEAQNIIAQYDVDGDGQLDPQEFEQLKQQVLDQQRQGMTNTMNANQQYDQFDADDDGRVDANELAQACNISVVEAQNIIAQYDVDGDGKLDAQEFEQLKQQVLDQQRQGMTNTMNANQQYNQFDADDDGRVDANELAQACNISVVEAQNIIAQYDVDGDGKLDAQEFEQLKQQIMDQQRQGMTNTMNANQQYNQFDADDDGRVDANELANACNISVVEAQNIIAQYDVDGDGKLDAQEFEQLKQQILEQQRQAMSNKMGANQEYNELDANDDGRVDANELGKACNISEQEARNIIAQYDVDGDGKLDAQEFEQLKQQILEQQRQAMSNKMGANQEYNELDANDDGRVDANELGKACNISEQEARNIIAQYDVDGDGKLDAQEFEQLKDQIMEEQRANVSNRFDENTKYNPFDANDDGKVSAQELANACNISHREAQLLIQQNDTDGDGYLDTQEFERLKAQIVSDRASKEEEKQATYSTPQFGGNIKKVNDKEYTAHNSNAKAFGVNIFGNPNEAHKAPAAAAQSRPFGQPPTTREKQKHRRRNSNRFGQPKAQAAVNNPSPFGNSNNANVSSNNASPFGKGAQRNEVPESAVKVNRGRRYKHKWALFISYDPVADEISLKVEDTVTGGVWNKTVGKQEHYGDIKQEYFRIGGLINDGKAKYTYPPNGVGAVQVSLTKATERYDFSAV
eukprot:554074_1